jgi:putative membrane protein
MDEPVGRLVARSAMGGVLMGLANLVPGISGGTMLVAAGVYTRFIEAVSDVTTLRFRPRSLVHLASVGLAALAAIVLLAGPVKGLVTDHRWVMYSLFIGLTLGGVPVVWRLARGGSAAFALGAVAGLAVMAVTAFTRPGGEGALAWWALLLGGVAGAAAMVLPGISGAYILLVLGQYEPILGAVDRVKHGELMEPVLFLAPFALGVALGIAGISNLLKWLLAHEAQPTLGVLLGLLVGSVLGIYPFQESVAKGAPRVFFTPTAVQVAAALGLVVSGFLATLLVDRLGRGK